MSELPIEPEKFSEHFKLKTSQNDLEFLDIYSDRDIPLFLDPYGISAMESEWSQECENQIATYFQYLIDSIKNGDKRTVTKLLSALHEVDEVALGYSVDSTSGRGIGPLQAKQIQEAFEDSEAAKSGDIRDLADCALLIPGINRDKVSDITANILKIKLIEFTQEQCDRLSIPMQRVAVNNAFDFNRFDFTSYFAHLPVINGKAKILLPISSVRRSPELSKDKYYRNFVIEYLRAEHSHAGDSLATVLKNGRVVVRINDLKERYPMAANFLYKFSKEHPQILTKYKSELKRTAKSKSKAKLSPKKKILTAQERIRILTDIPPGNSEATNYHKISYSSLIYILGNRISMPCREKEINEGRKRIDIVFDNVDKKGFFHRLNNVYNIQCPKILVECKNYGREIGNPELDQLQSRLTKRRGMFGILLCRSIRNPKTLLKRCTDFIGADQGYIIVLDDSDFAILINLKEDNKEKEIDLFLNAKFDNLIM